MQNYPVELLRSMLEIYSPSGSEERFANFLQRQMSSRGFEVRRDNVGNVIGELGREGPSVLLCGHMDTVPGEIPVQTVGDFMYGRGSVDAKSALAAMIIGGSLAAKSSLTPVRVVVAGVVCEETTSAGVEALINQTEHYDLAVFGEPSGVSNIIIGYKGSLQLQVTCLTKGGHSAAPWLSKNSYEEAFEFWSNFKNTLLENDSASKFSAVTGCVTNATAGETLNNIPSRAQLVIDVRTPPDLRTSDVADRIEEFAEEYQRKHEGIRISVEVKGATEPFLGLEDSIAVRAFRWAIRKTMACQPELVKKTGTSDMNLFAQSYPIPMVAYGPGNSALDHSENEHISIAEYLKSIEIYANAIQQIAHLMQNRSLQTTPVS